MNTNVLYISNETYIILQPLLFITKLVGLCPLSVEKIGSQYKMKYSVYLVGYSYLLAVILAIATLSGITEDLMAPEHLSIRMGNKKTKYITCCDISIVIGVVIFIIVCTPFRIRNFWKLIKMCHQMDCIVPLTSVNKYRKNSIYFIAIIISLFSGTICMDVAVWQSQSKPKTLFYKLYTPFYFMYYIVIVQEIFFWHLVFLIKIRMSSLNKGLEAEKRNKEKAYGGTVSNGIFIFPYGECNLLNKINGKKKVESSDKENDRQKDNKHMHLVDRIMALSHMHEKILQAVQLINNSSSNGIVLIMVSCLLHLVVTPYFLLSEISNRGDALFISLQTVWLLAHIGRLLVIVEPCHNCVQEAQRTRNLIVELLNCDFEANVKMALTNFATQLSFCEINFNSCGFFSIHRGILTTIAGAVSTYLVILFQFNN